jgi:hypothetical protein
MRVLFPKGADEELILNELSLSYSNLVEKVKRRFEELEEDSDDPTD